MPDSASGQAEEDHSCYHWNAFGVIPVELWAQPSATLSFIHCHFSRKITVVVAQWKAYRWTDVGVAWFVRRPQAAARCRLSPYLLFLQPLAYYRVHTTYDEQES